MSGAKLARNLGVAVVALAVVFGGAGIASADLITGNVVSAYFNGPGTGHGTQKIHEPGATADTFINVYTGPYSLTVNGDAQASLWMCFDASVMLDTSPLGNPWHALVEDASGTATKYFNIGSDISGMLAYLSSQWVPGTSDYGLKKIQLALWEVTADYNGNLADLNVGQDAGFFYIENLNNSQLVLDVNALLGNAYTAVVLNKGIFDSTFLLPTDHALCSNDCSGAADVSNFTQPFVGPGGHPVPEPGTLLLLGSGLLGGVAFARRIRK